MFPLPDRVQYLPVFIYCPENFLISNFIKPADLFHSSPIHISKASNLLSVCVNVHVSAAYSATLQTKHFIILFFSSNDYYYNYYLYICNYLQPLLNNNTFT